VLLHTELYRPGVFLAFVVQRKVGIECMNYGVVKVSVVMVILNGARRTELL
jgi:hypothetical protein